MPYWLHSAQRPESWVDTIEAHVPASRSQIPSQFTGSLSPSHSPSHSFAQASSSSHSLYIPPFPPPPLPPPPPVSTFSLPTRAPSLNLSVSKSRSGFPFSASKISKATRSATAWFAEHAARKGSAESIYGDNKKKQRTAELEAVPMATKIRTEEDPRIAVIRARASEAVKSRIQLLLSHDFPDDEYDSVLKECDQICANGGLDLSVVLQEPLIDGRPPVYWAILNRHVTTSRNGDAALHALVLSLLGTGQPLKETTITSIRLACMVTSNNTLLQHLFWHFPALSPLSRSDAMLLSSAGGGDVVDVDETHDGTGTFVARIQIRRFRLRMRVSKLVKVEFVTSDRIWTVTFSVSSQNAAIRSETRWLLSFGLGDHSTSTWVDGDFLILRRLPSSVESGDTYERIFSLPFGYNPCQLQPGPESAIKMRLDDGPLGPHLLNESQALVDRDGTLHAQFNVRLVQTQFSTLPPSSFSFSDGASLMSTVRDTRSISTRQSKPAPARSLIFKSRDKRNRKVPDGEKKVYTSLRRGGR
ncbi:hypothetical protein EDB83DRAFT_2318072 [Lactarius deliciosus]|nr:hypothetical protein EDB83DRAFT_2318072 [Lactarius deliciosus]